VNVDGSRAYAWLALGPATGSSIRLQKRNTSQLRPYFGTADNQTSKLRLQTLLFLSCLLGSISGISVVDDDVYHTLPLRSSACTFF
jgi:hypothetical protein